MGNVKVGVFTGAGWFVGWFFTIGFAHLTFGQGIFAVVAWPYYLGVEISRLVS